jgi:hypothetical protein
MLDDVPLATTRSTSDGSFALDLPDGGDIYISVAATGYRSAILPLVATPGQYCMEAFLAPRVVTENLSGTVTGP